MSFSNFIHPDNDDQLPDVDAAFSGDTDQRETAAQVLPVLALETSLPKKTAQLLAQGSGILIVKLPNRDWSDLIVGALRRFETRPHSCVLRHRNVAHRKGITHLPQGMQLVRINLNL